MLLYVIKCLKEGRKLACDTVIPSVPKYLVNKERLWVQSDSVLGGFWGKAALTEGVDKEQRKSLMRSLLLPGPGDPANHLWAPRLPLENKSGHRVERISRCYLGHHIIIGLNISIYLRRHPSSLMRPTETQWYWEGRNSGFLPLQLKEIV